MLNWVILQGRLSKDIELKKTNTGSSYIDFILSWTETKDEHKQKLYMVCRAWNKVADLIYKNFNKGEELIIEGKMCTDLYKVDGEEKLRTYLYVTRVHFTQARIQQDRLNQETDVLFI